jgi:hypothetical protein
MAAQPQTATGPEQDAAIRRQVDEALGNEPEPIKAALVNAIRELQSGQITWTESAGRVGLRQGKVSELTVLMPLKPGGAERLRRILKLLHGHFSADKVGTVHDMRFLIVDNDTKLLFATAYDGQWDPYIEDFATKIPDEMDMVFSSLEGWPGIRDPSVKDYIVKHQIPADAWYVASPSLTVADTRRLERVGKALDEFLDKISG